MRNVYGQNHTPHRVQFVISMYGHKYHKIFSVIEKTNSRSYM
jgi:hypothetical protein